LLQTDMISDNKQCMAV